MIKVNGLSVSRIPINGKETLRVMKNGQQLWSGTGLPAGYTLLEYIESTGSQYIDTAFYGNDNLQIVVDAYLSQETGGVNHLCGYYKSNNNSLTINIGSNNNSRFGTLAATGLFSTNVGERHVYEMDKNYAKVDGSITKTWGTVTSFTTVGTIYLFKTNGVSTVANWRIYSCKFYDNGEIVRDFIPCKNPSGVCGLYDKVNKVFYGSASSTPFTGA